MHRKDLYGWSRFDEARNLDFHSVLRVRPEGNVVFDPLPVAGSRAESDTFPLKCDAPARPFKALNGKGFIQTGHDAGGHALASPYATSRLGIYAVGEVRSGSVKRGASGVGEGSVVVQTLHGVLNPGVV